MWMFGAVLVIYGILFSALFGRIILSLSGSTEETITLQSRYYNGYAVLSPMHVNLNNYLNLYSEEYLGRYEESKTEFMAFIELLKSDEFGVYSHDLARICEKYVQAADQAVADRERSSGKERVASYQEADRIKNLITLFSSYSIKEIEEAINTNLASLNNDMFSEFRNTIIALLVATLLLIAAAALFVRYFLSPLHSLTGLVRRVSAETWEVQTAPDTRKDEMGLLIQAFYEMLNNNRHQYDELLRKQRLEMELKEEREKNIQSEALLAKSELKVFQSQINSHFLFNTLNTVSRMAYMENAPQVQNATNLVAQFLRTTLNQFNRVVTLSEEFSNVENYVEIQTLRFDDRIQVEAVMDVEFEWFEVPSMTLQPLVENAFRHGVSDKKSGFIKYAAEKEGDSLLLSVWDDGKGMTPEQQKKLYERLQNGESSENLEHMGLFNIYKRLCLYYPGRVTPVIDSEPGRFSKIGFLIGLSG